MYHNYEIIETQIGKVQPINVNDQQIVYYSKAFKNKPNIYISDFENVYHIKPGKHILYYQLSNYNYQDEISCIQTLEGSYSEIYNMLQMVKELCGRINGTTTQEDCANIVSEITQLRDEIQRVANTTNYNYILLFVSDLKFYIYSTFTYEFDSIKPVTNTIDVLSELISDFSELSLEDFKTKVHDVYLNSIGNSGNGITLFRGSIGSLQNMLEHLIMCTDSMYENTKQESGNMLDELIMKDQFSKGVFGEFYSVSQKINEFLIHAINGTNSTIDIIEIQYEIDKLFDMFNIVNDMSFLQLGSVMGLTLPNSNYDIYSTDYTQFFNQANTLREAIDTTMQNYIDGIIEYEQYAEQMTEHIQSNSNIIDNISIYRGSLGDLQNTIEVLNNINSTSDTDIIERIIELCNRILTFPNESDIVNITNEIKAQNKLLKYYYENIPGGTGKTLNTTQIVDNITNYWDDNHNIESLQEYVNDNQQYIVNNLSEIYQKDNVTAVFDIKLITGDSIRTRKLNV